MPTSPLQTHWGPLLISTDATGALDVRAHPDDLDPAPFSGSLRQSRTARVARPAVRSGWLAGGPGTRTAARGREPFVEVDWDEALELVAGELRRVRDTYGHPAVFGGSYGWGSAGRFHMPNGQIARFMRLFGGCTDVWGTYSSCAAEGIIPYVLGMPYFVAQSELTSWSSIAEHTELFVSFGGLRVSNANVTFIGQGPHRTREWMRAARRRGTTFVNVSPLRDDIDAEFEPRWVHPRPGTDTALMAALIHTLVSESLHDADFLASHCVGWPQLEAYLTGRTDGEPKSADWAAGICALAAEDIRALAREMRARRTLVNVTYAMQRQHHGEQPYWMAVALAAALGHVGLPGGGFAFHFGSAGNPGTGRKPVRVPGLPVPPRPDGMPVIPVSRITELLEARAGEPFEANGERGVYPDTRLVYWAGGNIHHHHQDLNRLDRAWRRPDTIVVHEPFWTPMARRADIVLPATTPLERAELGNADSLLLAVQPVYPPFGEARDDYAIFAALAARLGFGDAFTEGRDAEGWIEHLYDRFRAGDNAAPTFEEFRAAGTYRHAVAAMGETRQDFLAAFRADPGAHPLGTPSGRIELFSATVAGYGYDDCPGHPAWLEPYERLGTPAAARHPLHLVSNQPARRLHSQYDHGEASRATKSADREPCRLHPATAAARGIADGDVVRLFNDRGACLAVARLDDAVMADAVQLSTGAWYDPDDTGLCKAGNPNVLTRDQGTSALAQGPTAHTCLVEVERFAGTPPPVTAYDPPPFVERNAAR